MTKQNTKWDISSQPTKYQDNCKIDDDRANKEIADIEKGLIRTVKIFLQVNQTSKQIHKHILTLTQDKTYDQKFLIIASEYFLKPNI